MENTVFFLLVFRLRFASVMEKCSLNVEICTSSIQIRLLSEILRKIIHLADKVKDNLHLLHNEGELIRLEPSLFRQKTGTEVLWPIFAVHPLY